METPRDYHVADSWLPVDLTTVDDSPQRKPDLAPNYPLKYPRCRVLVSAPPESVKSLLEYAYALDVVRDGGKVAIVDFEMGTRGALQLLRELGASDEEIRAVHFFDDPQEAMSDTTMERLTAEGYAFVLIDAGVGAYSLEGVDDNKRDDYEEWARNWIDPLWKSDATVAVIDHEAKSSSRWAIGTERKRGRVDVHLRLEEVTKLVRGGSGIYRVIVEKDRPGYIRELAPKGWDLHIFSDPETHMLRLSLRPRAGSSDEGFRPTTLMERVSQYVQENDGCSPSNARANVTGKAQGKLQAIDALVREGYLEKRDAKMGSTLHHVQPFTVESDLFDTAVELARSA
jgi:hypothetical protein